MAEIKYEVVQRIAVLSQRPQRLGAPAQPHQLERRRPPSTTSRDWSPDGTRMGKGISLSHDELAILKGILDDLEL